jgi:hypothetical protein
MADGQFLLPLKTSLTTQELFQLLTQVAGKTGVHIDRIENLHLHLSEVSMDGNNKSQGNVTVGNISGSTVGSLGAARDIKIFANNVDSSDLSEELKRELKEARKILEGLALAQQDKDDVADDLAKLTAELGQPEAQRQPSRIQRYWERIRSIAPSVASALSIAASIAKLTGHA